MDRTDKLKFDHRPTISLMISGLALAVSAAGAWLAWKAYRSERSFVAYFIEAPRESISENTFFLIPANPEHVILRAAVRQVLSSQKIYIQDENGPRPKFDIDKKAEAIYDGLKSTVKKNNKAANCETQSLLLVDVSYASKGEVLRNLSVFQANDFEFMNSTGASADTLSQPYFLRHIEPGEENNPINRPQYRIKCWS